MFPNMRYACNSCGIRGLMLCVTAVKMRITSLRSSVSSSLMRLLASTTSVGSINTVPVSYTHLVTTILGLVYIYLEYKASIWLWIVGIVMPAMDVFLYWRHGLYGDAGMAVYYMLAAIYGYIAWKWGSKLFNQKKQELPITHMPGKHYRCV